MTVVSMLTLPPRLTAAVHPDCARLHCEVTGSQRVRIFTRTPNASWRALVDLTETADIEDHTPNEIPWMEETREYQAIAMLDGEETDHPSDIVTVTLPGRK